uniref:hypothetical protein n=1 Tax=uncultured Sphingomonas sp. TaxID=158754 RepID=UPI0035C9E727
MTTIGSFARSANRFAGRRRDPARHLAHRFTISYENGTEQSGDAINMSNPRATSRESGYWSESNLKPIAWAFALALLIVIVPVAYRISKCANFAMGLSLNQLFSFKCTATDKSTDLPHTGISPPRTVPTIEDGSQPTIAQLRARTLMPPEGYVSYRVSGGFPRMDTGALQPLNGDAAPPYDAVKEGLILKAVADKPVHQRPYSSSEFVTDRRGQCYQVIHGDAIQDENPAGERSGGWLPVRRSACDQSSPAAAEPITPVVVKPSQRQVSSPASARSPAAGIKSPTTTRKSGNEQPLKTADYNNGIDGLTREEFKQHYSRGYREWSWHVIVKSVRSEAEADKDVARLNVQYPALWFEDVQTNSDPDWWAVTLGSGIGTVKAFRLQRFVRNFPNFQDAYAYCWGVGQADPSHKCEP